MEETTRKYIIKEVIKEADRLVVIAEFFEGDEMVGSINHAFALTRSEEYIENEVMQSCKVFFQGRDRAEANAVKNKIDAEAEIKKENLTNNSQSI